MKNREFFQNEPSSFRDPSGVVFFRDGEIYRQINELYKENYDHLINSGLYETLVDSGLLIPHEEICTRLEPRRDAYKIIKPEMIHFISYPYEWCFSQLKDAALLTLEIQKKSLDANMSLKDCSAYNIQFNRGKPVFIDTLSFERYTEGKPWTAYRQFCQHFLAPLALQAYKDIRLNQLFRVYMDGIPLDLAGRLLPFRTFLNLTLLLHVHLHSGSQKRYGNKPLSKQTRSFRFDRLSMLGIIDSLESAIKRLKWEPQGTEWGTYYDQMSYSSQAFSHKKEMVAHFIDESSPKFVWDLGANTGKFSFIAAEKGAQTISFDIDPAAVEKNYIECIKRKLVNMLPLLLDLTNPSPSIGWENKERTSLLERGPADLVIALALIHHLAISNNLPFDRIAHFFHEICSSLIIEFVPKNDSQVQRLLSSRDDIYPNYKQDAFENYFRKFFRIMKMAKISDSDRILYLMARR